MANILRVPQQFGVNFAYANCKQALQAIGEEVILLKMYKVNTDAETQPRCGVCFDDVYKANADPACPYCYGTTFAGGINEAWRAWCVVDDQTEDETISKNGVWQNEDHAVQAEPYPPLEENDYMIRVKSWDSRKQAPLEIGGYFKVGPVKTISVRTGARFGGVDNFDRISQKFTAKLMPTSHVIYKYDVIKEVTFPRYDAQPR